MPLVLTEEQQLLKDSARNFCQQNAPIGEMRKLRDSKDERGYSETLWKQMAELGWPGMAIPETYAGFDFGYGGLGVVLEETGRTLAASPLISTVLLSATAIVEAGNDNQKTSLLPQIVSGDLLVSLALDETPVHNPSNIALSAAGNDSGFILNGSKTFVLDGHVANKFIVAARSSGEQTSTDGISLFLVNSDQNGVDVTRTMMVDCRNAAKVSFNNVQVTREALLGELNGGYRVLEKVLDIGRIGLAAEMLGSIEQTFEMVLEYLKTRAQFGVLIGSFQGLQHRAATMYSEIELCRSTVRATLSALDNDELDASELAKLASIAKAKLSEVFALVSNEGVQMHGGIGMTDEFDVGFFMKRARVAQQFLGDAAFHRDRYATLNNF